MEVVYKDFLDMKKSVIDWENLHKRYSHLGDKVIIKVEKMILKEMEAEISNSTNK